MLNSRYDDYPSHEELLKFNHFEIGQVYYTKNPIMIHEYDGEEWLMALPSIIDGDPPHLNIIHIVDKKIEGYVVLYKEKLYILNMVRCKLWHAI